jgi:hypothetical protein
MARFKGALVNWIVADDQVCDTHALAYMVLIDGQSINVVECMEYRQLLLTSESK